MPFLRNTKVSRKSCTRFSSVIGSGRCAIRERIRFSEEAFHLLLAGGVGVIGGLVNIFFYYATESVRLLFLRQPGELVEVAELMAPWQRVLTPTAGRPVRGAGAALGPADGGAAAFEQPAGGRGGGGRAPAVSQRPGEVPLLAGHDRVGRVHRAGGRHRAVVGDAVVEVGPVGASGSRTGCGCWWGAGRPRALPAAYNAPISGAVFAALIVLGNFSMSLFAPLVFASVVATMVSRSFFGIQPWYTVPPFEFTRLTQLPWFVCLGILSGGDGSGVHEAAEPGGGAVQEGAAPIYVRLALGGLVVGIIAVWFPGVWGNGYVDHQPHLARGLWRAQAFSAGDIANLESLAEKTEAARRRMTKSRSISQPSSRRPP